MLALLEVLERDGHVRRSLPVLAWPLRLGRAIDNDVVLEDPHVAPYHALIRPGTDGQPEALALPGVNGLAQGRRRIAPGERLLLAGGGQFVAGHTRLRLRLPGEALAPELPLAHARGPWITLAIVLVFWLWGLIEHAIETDPGSPAAEWLPPVLAPPLTLLAWTAAWTLASKLFRRRLDFWPHLRVAAVGSLAIAMLAWQMPVLAGISGWDGLSRLAGGTTAALTVAMITAHACIVLPQLRRRLVLAAGAGYAVGCAVTMGLHHERQDRWFSELYTAALPPPALRLAPLTEPGDFLRDAARLEARLQAAVREAQDERMKSGDGDDE
jgi:hypothetical protein